MWHIVGSVIKIIVNLIIDCANTKKTFAYFQAFDRNKCLINGHEMGALIDLIGLITPCNFQKKKQEL